MGKARERSKCYYILLFCEIVNKKQYVLYLFNMKERWRTKKKKIFFCQIGNWEKNILFGIWNGAEFQPQNRVIKSPVGPYCLQYRLPKNISRRERRQ